MLRLEHRPRAVVRRPSRRARVLDVSLLRFVPALPTRPLARLKLVNVEGTYGATCLGLPASSSSIHTVSFVPVTSRVW